MATVGSMTMATGANQDQVALRDTNQTTGWRWIHNATESISLFVSGAKAKIKDTFKIIAAKGNVQMQAQDGEIAATAQKDFTITSVNGKVTVHAPKEILLTAGGGYIRIGKDIEIHNPGKQSQKAAGFALSSPESMHLPLPELPIATPGQGHDEAFAVRDPSGKVMSSLPYSIDHPNGKQMAHTSADGLTSRIRTDASEKMKFALQWLKLDKKN